jgi:hypothetical protein
MSTAWADGHRVLFHWQVFNETYLTKTLRDSVIYCSNPAHFNDPWDCKVEFNTEVLSDPHEREKHIQWATELSRRYNRGMTEVDIVRMQESLRTDRVLAETLISRMSREVSTTIAARYRVYCLGPDVNNLLMWAHYANNHKGICLEFNLRNEVMCSAMGCVYLKEYPAIRAYSRSEDDNLSIVLAKAEVWSYEMEYRLIALERSAGQISPNVLMTDNNLLPIPNGALVAVIVGCQGDYDRIKALVASIAPDVKIKQAVRVANRYELRIEE